MPKSLIDAIGRKRAHALMESAVLQAIEENRALGLGKQPEPPARHRSASGVQPAKFKSLPLA